MSAPRTGSMATKAISTLASFTASTTWPAEVKVISSNFTPKRWANSRDKSTDTPRAWPVAGSRVARIGLPKLMAARKVPPGANSETVAAGALGADEQALNKVVRASARTTKTGVIFMGRALVVGPFTLSLACPEPVEGSKGFDKLSPNGIDYSILALARNSSWYLMSFCWFSCWAICGLTSSSLGAWASRTSSRRMM